MVLCFFSCEEPDPVFPEVITLQCQEDVTMFSGIIESGVFDEKDPGAAFRGDVIIQTGSGCDSPISDLSFFNAHRFWLGSISIESDDITDLDFLKNVEQVRGGLRISNCNKLQKIDLPKMGFVGQFLSIEFNEELRSIEIGTSLPEAYEQLGLDSVRIVENPKLAAWVPSSEILDFVKYAEIKDNPELKDLRILRDFSMPSTAFLLDMYGTVVNTDTMNIAMDSLPMPNTTIINAKASNNDFSWLSKAKVSPRFNEDGIDVGRITEFSISGDVVIEDLCPLKTVAEKTSLEVNSTSAGLISAQDILDNCPE